jgi:hypothetical protein
MKTPWINCDKYRSWLLPASVALAAGALVWSASAWGQSQPLLDTLFPAGEDFCFGRTYDAAHLARNPKQTVKAIFVGGRNAQRTAAEPGPRGDIQADGQGRVYVSLAVSFRDGSRVWSGVCLEETPGTVGCKILPHRNRDSVEQGLMLRQADTGLTVEAEGDWAHFRAAVDDDQAGKAAPDDRLFRVARLPVSACSLSRAHWSPKGATAKFLSDFP